LHYRKGRCVVREGDSLLKMAHSSAEGTAFEIRISKVDGSGVEVSRESVDHASDGPAKASSWRIGFGKGRRLEPIGMSIAAERGSGPATAIIEIRGLE
jgi:hypothetical protein